MSTYETLGMRATYCDEHAVERLIAAGEASPAARDMSMRDLMAQIDDVEILRYEHNSGHCADCVDAKVARFLTLWDEAGLYLLPEPYVELARVCIAAQIDGQEAMPIWYMGSEGYVLI